jgi:hypothetical protein
MWLKNIRLLSSTFMFSFFPLAIFTQITTFWLLTSYFQFTCFKQYLNGIIHHVLFYFWLLFFSSMSVMFTQFWDVAQVHLSPWLVSLSLLQFTQFCNDRCQALSGIMFEVIQTILPCMILYMSQVHTGSCAHTSHFCAYNQGRERRWRTQNTCVQL